MHNLIGPTAVTRPCVFSLGHLYDISWVGRFLLEDAVVSVWFCHGASHKVNVKGAPQGYDSIPCG